MRFWATILGAVLSAAPAFATTFTVTTTADSGAGSLRDAITQVNLGAGGDTINFSIAGAGLHTITPATDLPSINQQVTVDCTTQSGADPANGVWTIKVQGSGVIETPFVFSGAADGSTIRGCWIDGFVGAGGNATGILLSSTDNNTVAGNKVSNCGKGITSGNASGNTIGGATAADRNVLIGSTNSEGVLIFNGVSANTVQGNWIGVDENGNPAGNLKGIAVEQTATGTVIDANVISANSTIGIHTDATSSGASISNNLVGTTTAGAFIGTYCNGKISGSQIDDAAGDSTITGNTINPMCPPGCCKLVNVPGGPPPTPALTCYDNASGGPQVASTTDCETVVAGVYTPGPGTPTPFAEYYNSLVACSTPGDSTSVCAAPPTATPTETPMEPPPPTEPTFSLATPTPTLAPASALCEPTRFCAWKFRSLTTPTCVCSGGAFVCTLTIPGLQRGDFIRFEHSLSATINGIESRVLANNTAEIRGTCLADLTSEILDYFWWDRTYDNTSKNQGDAR